MNRSAVAAAAPERPACFSDRAIWIDYLHSAQDGKKQPFRHGVFQPSFNFCHDCSLAYSALMEREGRCTPTVFSAKAPAATTEEAVHGS